MSESWRYIQNGEDQIPVTEEELKRLIASGQLSGEVLVWRPGMAEWSKARLVPELMPIPAPPVPGQEPRNLFEAPRAVVRSIPEATSLDGQAAVAGALEALRATKPWARFLGVLGIVGIALMAALSIVMAVVSRGPFKGLPGPLRVVLPLIYILMASFQIPPVIYLNRYASRIGALLRSHSPGDLTLALETQKAFWRYVGILALVFMCLYAGLILFGIGAVVFTGAARHI